MTTIIFNKPFGVLSQFTDKGSVLSKRSTLSDYINVPNVYAAGRLDFDSEGLMILTNNGTLQAKIAHPKFKAEKTYWVQIEGIISKEALCSLRNGITLKDGETLPAKAVAIPRPTNLWERSPPIRVRKSIPDSWIELKLMEGRNRQVRRMTAHVGFPTLRLIRVQIGHWGLAGLASGIWRKE